MKLTRLYLLKVQNNLTLHLFVKLSMLRIINKQWTTKMKQDVITWEWTITLKINLKIRDAEKTEKTFSHHFSRHFLFQFSHQLSCHFLCQLSHQIFNEFHIYFPADYRTNMFALFFKISIQFSCHFLRVWSFQSPTCWAWLLMRFFILN